MSFKSSNHCKILFDHLRLSFNVVLMCKIGKKYQHASRAVCAYVHGFRKRPGCALFGACALIRMNTAFILEKLTCLPMGI